MRDRGLCFKRGTVLNHRQLRAMAFASLKSKGRFLGQLSRFLLDFFLLFTAVIFKGKKVAGRIIPPVMLGKKLERSRPGQRKRLQLDYLSSLNSCRPAEVALEGKLEMILHWGLICYQYARVYKL